MDADRLKASIKVHEGYRQKPYQCSEGYWTVGYGHKVHDLQLTAMAGTVRTLGELLNWCCDKDRHEEWLEDDINRSISDAIRWAGQSVWDSLTDHAREVITEMAFQLGGSGLGKFRNFGKAIAAQDYQRAAAEMKDSLWYRQTPNRVADLAAKLVT